MANQPDAVDLAREAALHIVAGDKRSAESCIRMIDTDALEMERRAAHERVRERVIASQWIRPKSAMAQNGRNPARKVRLAVFRRDSYTCRYAHCRRRTIDDVVLRLLSKALPDMVPYHRHWKLGQVHPLFWTSTASLDHVVAWTTSGSNDEKTNLVTACSCCQYAKKDYDLKTLNWELTIIADAFPPWDGLKNLEDGLRHAIARSR